MKKRRESLQLFKKKKEGPDRHWLGLLHQHEKRHEKKKRSEFILRQPETQHYRCCRGCTPAQRFMLRGLKNQTNNLIYCRFDKQRDSPEILPHDTSQQLQLQCVTSTSPTLKTPSSTPPPSLLKLAASFKP